MAKPRKAIRWTPERVAALSEVSPADLEEAKAWAARNAPPGPIDPVALLSAQPKTE